MERENNRLVVKSNKLIEASYKLTLNEQRVLLAGISQIDSRKSLAENMTFDVRAQDIQDMVGLEDNKNVYRALRAASERLYERTVTIDDPEPENPGKTKRKTRWISSIDYVPGEGMLVMTFSPGIIPYLSKLTSSFTKYKLNHIAKFESVYSIRMYEMFSQWAGVGRYEVSVEEFRDRLMVKDLYKRFTDLKKRILDPGIAEINKHSNINAKYGLRKTGRSVTHIQFEFSVKGGVATKHGIINEKLIEAEAKPGESRDQVIARLKRKADADPSSLQTYDYLPAGSEAPDQGGGLKKVNIDINVEDERRKARAIAGVSGAARESED